MVTHCPQHHHYPPSPPGTRGTLTCQLHGALRGCSTKELVQAAGSLVKRIGCRRQAWLKDWVLVTSLGSGRTSSAPGPLYSTHEGLGGNYLEQRLRLSNNFPGFMQIYCPGQCRGVGDRGS